MRVYIMCVCVGDKCVGVLVKLYQYSNLFKIKTMNESKLTFSVTWLPYYGSPEPDISKSILSALGRIYPFLLGPVLLSYPHYTYHVRNENPVKYHLQYV